MRATQRANRSLLFLLVVLNIVGGLALEFAGAARGWTWAEPLGGIVTLAHFCFYLWRPPLIGELQLTRVMLLVCLGLATFGELVLSAVWGLYDYRVSTLPFFVPPGHVLLFLAGLSVASHDRCGKWVSFTVPGLAAAALAYQLVSGVDSLSVPLFVIFIACLLWGNEKKLYAVMFVLALLLELYGTALGTWTWQARVPALGIASANPPLAAGVFYALLDLLTVWLAMWIATSSAHLFAGARPPPS